MTDLVSTPPAPLSPPNSSVAIGGGWWPAIDVNGLRAAVNLGGEIPHPRLVDAIRYGVETVLGELEIWQAAQLAAGFTSLVSIEPVVMIDGKTRIELAFIRAVNFHAAAFLADGNPNLTATREGSDRGEDRRIMADDFRRDATHAIRDIQGKTRVTSELI